MKRLMDEFGLTQEQLAERLGKSRPAIANTLRLLSLAEEVIDLVRDGKLSSGHARTLVPVAKEAQTYLAKECVKNSGPSGEMERAVKQYLNPPEVLAKDKEKKNALANAELKHLVERLRSTLKTKVSLIGTDKKGRIYIDYYTRDDLERISELLDIIDRMEVNGQGRCARSQNTGACLRAEPDLRTCSRSDTPLPHGHGGGKEI